MKQLVTICATLLLNYSFSQVETTPQSDVQHYSVGTPKREASNQTGQGVLTLEQIDARINALETKRTYVQSIPEEDQIAKEQGWYELIDGQLEELRTLRTNLANDMKQNTQKAVVKKSELDKMPAEKKEFILSHPETYIIEQ